MTKGVFTARRVRILKRDSSLWVEEAEGSFEEEVRQAGLSKAEVERQGVSSLRSGNYSPRRAGNRSGLLILLHHRGLSAWWVGGTHY